MSFETRKNLENNNPLNPSQNLDKSQKAEQVLAGRFQDDMRMRDMSTEEKKKVQEVQTDIQNLMQDNDIIKLNEKLRDPALKGLISDKLRREINDKLRAANKEKVRWYINAGNMGAVTDEMAAQLHEVKGWYHELFQRIDTELVQPEALTEDRDTLLSLRDEVEEAEWMVANLLSKLAAIGEQRVPQKNNQIA